MSRRHAPIPPLRAAPEAVVLALASVLLAWWSWRKWPDILIDFGQQLYIPWRLAAGDRLYLDIAFLHGPFSQHFNAIWFATFGPSFTVLIFVNLAILAALTWIVYRIARLVTGRFAATVAGLALLCMFGFSQYVGTGNYNFIAPYTHESTHGTVLAAAMILALSLALTKGGRRFWVMAGFCGGLAFLTKVEVGLAATATAAAGLLAATILRTPRWKEFAWFAASAVAPGFAFFLYFLSYLRPGRAAGAVLGGFAALSGEVAANPFYRRVAGTDDPSGNLGRMLVMSGVAAAFLLIGIAIDALARRLAREPAAAGLAAGVMLFLALVLWPGLVPWRELPRALPVASGVIVIALLRRFWRVRGDPTRWRPIVPALLFAVFALTLLGKTVLNVHLYHYGFYLALPATLMVVILGIDTVPSWLSRRIGCGVVFRSLALALLAAGMVYHLRWSQELYRLKSYRVGSGGDTVLTYDPAFRPAGPAVEGALRWLEENTSADATFVGFPEGIMLNYLSRRAAPTRCMNFMMTEMILLGEEELLRELRKSPPDYVLLVHKDTSEFGVGLFGRDPRYGMKIMEWVEDHYSPEILIGEEPLRDQRFGIKILKRERRS